MVDCDPHPGNLLRTPNGKLCILDWGMVTRLDGDLQITLSKFCVHAFIPDTTQIYFSHESNVLVLQSSIWHI